MAKPGGFSSQSYSPASSSGPLISSPLDPKDQSAKSEEKTQMVGLNDKFISFINKVKKLEDTNKQLETRLRILMDQEDYDGKIDDMVKREENEIQQQIDGVARDRLKLEADLRKSMDDVEKTKNKYEVELKKKTDLENDFVVTKKEADEGHLAVVKLAMELEELFGELDFLKNGYDEELKELESQVQNETVVIRNPTKRALDMDEVIDSMKAQYAEMAARSREEAEQWNQKKMDALVQSAGKYEQEARSVRKEIADMQRLNQRLAAELEGLKRKKESLEAELREGQGNGQDSMALARNNILQVEEALRQAKRDMAQQVREYQELMNLKLALDIEIATYRKLLEGEEMRLNNHMYQADVNPTRLSLPEVALPFQDPDPTTTPNPVSKQRLLIRVEVQEGRVVSESSRYTDE